jgi:hypothetical protein
MLQIFPAFPITERQWIVEGASAIHEFLFLAICGKRRIGSDFAGTRPFGLD